MLRPRAPSAGSMQINLQDGATNLGVIASLITSSVEAPVYCARRLIPTAASHTYKITANNIVSQTSTIYAGAGGAGVNMPGFIRITWIPT